MGSRISSVVFTAVLVVIGANTLADDDRSVAGREAILRRAQVWIEPAVPVEHASLDANPEANDRFLVSDEVECEFDPEPLGGNSPKFDCELKNGETIRVKYGRDNPEIYAEVAATRLLSALGFPTDAVYVVKRVRCFGCPPDPFRTYAGRVDKHTSIDFDDAIIERPRKGQRVEADDVRGWKWRELAKIDEAAGGAPRAHVDALRLLAVFLAHWDNKAENQRLICTDDACRRPLAMVHDLGGTFGPFKVELKGWAARSVWSDAATCTVSLRGLPYDGSTFDDVQISEAGRTFLAVRLRTFSDDQIRRLFAGARFDRAPSRDPAASDINSWMLAFKKKRDAIDNRAPCPA